MALRELMRAVPPPPEPVHTGSPEEWKAIERAIGSKLPGDYRQMIERYGTGSFYGSIEVFNPVAPGYVSLLEFERKRIREGMGISGNPLPVTPDIPGLFPLGRDDNGGTLFYWTGEPSAWSIIAAPVRARPDEFERHELPLTSFLANALTNKLKVAMWIAFEVGSVVFKPRLVREVKGKTSKRR